MWLLTAQWNSQGRESYPTPVRASKNHLHINLQGHICQVLLAHLEDMLGQTALWNHAQDSLTLLLQITYTSHVQLGTIHELCTEFNEKLREDGEHAETTLWISWDISRIKSTIRYEYWNLKQYIPYKGPLLSGRIATSRSKHFPFVLLFTSSQRWNSAFSECSGRTLCTCTMGSLLNCCRIIILIRPST
jgi:hypothetical protein